MGRYDWDRGYTEGPGHAWLRERQQQRYDAHPIQNKIGQVVGYGFFGIVCLIGVLQIIGNIAK